MAKVVYKNRINTYILYVCCNEETGDWKNIFRVRWCPTRAVIILKCHINPFSLNLGQFSRRCSASEPVCASLTVFSHVFCSLSSSLSRDLLTKKDPEFRSIFQHIQSAQLRRSPSELFAQHVVSIVHYIKGRV